jgi:tetratricopeptide (TPR) repeat protein
MAMHAKIPVRLTAILFSLLVLGANTLAQQEQEGLAAAHSLIQQNRLDEAIAQLKALAESGSRAEGINHELGVAYYRKGEYLEAAKYLKNAWQENADDRDAVQLLGLSYYLSGRPSEAIPPLEKVRSWNPNSNTDAIYILGLCYVLSKNYPRAQETFARLYGVPTESAAAHLVLARILLRQGFDPIAEDEARKALSLSPQLPFAHFTLGEFYVYKSDYSGAAQEFEQELVLNPGNAIALTRLGDVHWHLKRYDDAEKVLQRSIWLDSTASESHVILGKVLFSKGNLELAERTLQRAISIDPNSYTAHYFLGQVYRKMGKREAADQEIKLAAQIQRRQTQNAPR